MAAKVASSSCAERATPTISAPNEGESGRTFIRFRPLMAGGLARKTGALQIGTAPIIIAPARAARKRPAASRHQDAAALNSMWRSNYVESAASTVRVRVDADYFLCCRGGLPAAAHPPDRSL